MTLIELLRLSGANAQLPPIETFSADEGLPSPRIYAVAQHPSGRLWILSPIGLSVFDGRTFGRGPHAGLPQAWGFDLLAIDEQGTVCIASTQLQSVFRWEGERWQHLPLPRVETSATPLTSLVIGRRRRVPYIVLGSKAGLWLGGGERWNRLREDQGLPGDHVYSLVDLKDTIAVATSGGLCWLEKDDLGEREPVCTVRQEDPRLADPILALAPASSSAGVWLLTADWLGVLDRGGKLTVHQQGLGLSPALSSHLLADSFGGVYFGNQNRLEYFEPATVPKPYLSVPAGVLRSLGTTEGLAADGVTALVPDREGNVWVGSEQGLSRIGSQRFLSWRLTPQVTSIVESRPGRFVLGQENGDLTFLEEGQMRALTLEPGRVSEEGVVDLAAETDGTVWIAAENLGLWQLGPDGTLQRESSFDREALAVEIDSESRLWIASSRRVYFRRGETYEPLEPFPSMKIRWLTAGPDGRLYVSTETQGLAILDADEGWRMIRGPTEWDFVIGVLPEVFGTVWVGTNGGLHELRGNELVPVPLGEEYLRRPVSMIFRDPDGKLWFGTDDGMWVWDGARLRHLSFDQGLVGRETSRGAGIVDSQGHVWIGTDRGLSVYQARYDQEPATPTIELVGFEVDGQKRSPSGASLYLPYHENNLTWRFSTIAFSREADVVTRYRLEGFEETWHSGRQVREARYTNLPPGTYRFLVVAGWDGGAWSEEVVSGRVEIVPPLWLHPWFLLLLAATLAATVLGVHRLRLAVLRSHHATALQAEIDERQRLEAEREQLLQEIEAKDVLDPQTRQHYLLTQLLRAESPAHLAALRDEIREMDQTRGPARDHPSGFFAELHRMLESVQALESLPGNDDRAQVLSQALTRVLSMRDQMSHSLEEKPGGLALGALESIRQVFATALQGLRQSAELKLALRSKEVTAQREAIVVLEVRNVGKGAARKLNLQLTADESALGIRRRRQHLASLQSGQSAQLEFAVEPRRSDRVRLAFHVAYDDAERQGKEIDFADVMELRRFQESEIFRPLQPNPYVVGRPLLDADPFFGREDLFARLAASLQGAEQDNVVVLIGQRRMGKTSMLRRLHRYLPESYVPVLVDLQGLLGTGENAFFSEVVGQIVDELAEHDVDVREPPPAAFATDPGGFFRRRFLADVRAALGGRRLLVVFDELEVIEERIRAGELSPKILPYLRSLMQHEAGLSFLLAGTYRLDELTADYWGVLFNLAVYLDVGHLSEADVEALLREPTHESFEIDSLAVDKVWRTTGGHPHFSQLVARELVDFCNRGKISYVTVQDVNRVVDVVADKGQLHIAYLWDGASCDERLLLLATKELLEHGSLASLEAIDRDLAERGVHAEDLATAARQLRRKQILVEEAGQLSFGIGLLRIWLDRHHGPGSTAGLRAVGEET